MTSLLGSFYFLSFYVYTIIPLAPIVYIFIKWRSYRGEAPPDPQLGTKTVLYYFKTLAYHGGLVALVFICNGLIGMIISELLMGMGLFVAFAIIYGIHTYLIHKLTNTRQYPLTARAYTGFNLIITGFVGTISFGYIAGTLLGSISRGTEMILACLIVYCTAWIFQTISFCKPLISKKEKT